MLFYPLEPAISTLKCGVTAFLKSEVGVPAKAAGFCGVWMRVRASSLAPKKKDIRLDVLLFWFRRATRGSLFDFTCAAEMNSALRRGFAKVKTLGTAHLRRRPDGRFAAFVHSNCRLKRRTSKGCPSFLVPPRRGRTSNSDAALCQLFLFFQFQPLLIIPAGTILGCRSIIRLKTGSAAPLLPARWSHFRPAPAGRCPAERPESPTTFRQW